jgi:1-acyl-sn-glycerol-3-phosphate acyltransferase
MNFLRFLLFLLLKCTSLVAYPLRLRWIGEKPDRKWRNVQLVVFLNHTSLFEHIFISAFPTSFLWHLSRTLIFPAAEETLKRPLLGPFFRFMAPSVVSITRKRDHSWRNFLTQLGDNSALIFMAEGRMKRKNGLDKEGKPMTVRGGVVEALEAFRGKKALFAYSGGLHHIYPPGAKFPAFFKSVSLALEVLDINQYLENFRSLTDTEYVRAICADLERRRDLYCNSITS